MKTLLIGLDGGTWDIFGPLCDLGEMPNLANLRDRAAWSPLRSTQPPFTAPAWATFATGVNPGKHSILNFVRGDGSPAGSLRGQGTPVNSSDIRAPLLWEYFSAYDKTVGSINLPLSYPLRPVQGFAISGMLTPPNARDWITPRSLARSLNGYIIDLEYGRPGQPLRAEDLPSPLGMLKDIMRMTERRGMHSLRFMQTQPWDAFMVVFTGTDRLSHHFWHYLQPGSASRHLDVRIADKLQDYFSLLDQILGAMIKMAGPETNILMLSDHGFGHAARHWAHLNNWLLELDLLRLRMSKSSWMQKVKRSAPWLTDLAKRILPPEARKTVQQHGHLADAVDWDNTLAWAAPLYNNVVGITLHRTGGRQPGPVSPAAAPKLRDFIIRQARDLRIPGKGTPLITDIKTREELYTGPYVEQFPDIILTLDVDYAAVPTLGSTLITPIPPGQLLRSGDHRPDGMFLAAGPHIQPGRLARTPGLIDLAPTALYLAGLPIPESMDGQVIDDILDPEFLHAHPPQAGPDLPAPDPARALSPDENEAIADRLRGLGYLS
jgi:predicted AlkP superfamily phosphohydrolase/phosphomutase